MAMCDNLICHTQGATMTSDASGKWVATRSQTAVSGSSYRPAEWERVHIIVKELLPIFLGCAVWGWTWKGCTVRRLCDNAAVVAILWSALQRSEGEASHEVPFFIHGILSVSSPASAYPWKTK